MRIEECGILCRITSDNADQDRLNAIGEDKYRCDWTRGAWNMDWCKDWSPIRYAFCVNRDYEIKEVYEIDTWDEAGTTHYTERPYLTQKDFEGKWEFRGRRADDEIRRRYVGQSVREYYPPYYPIQLIGGCS